MPAAADLFDRPVIILAAPRSGSTLLFETLSEAPGVFTVGGESHQIIEGLQALNPMSGRVDSNRLDASHATAGICRMVRQRFASRLHDRSGARPKSTPVRMLEKTPKNALRQPFLEQVFPGALYLYLFRDPRPNISSMMEAWKARRWVTYRRLRGWRGPPWSLLLPPGWQALSGRPLAEICAFQWATTHQIILDDLGALPDEQWLACDYEQLTKDTAGTIRRICEFAEFDMDERLGDRVEGELPLSRYTQTAPDPDKWRMNEAEISPVMETVEPVWNRCRQVLASKSA